MAVNQRLVEIKNSHPAEANILIYDGDCGFCQRCSDWYQKRSPSVSVTPYQKIDLEKYSLQSTDVQRAAYFVESDGTLHRGHLAIGEALKHLGSIYKILGNLICRKPTSWIAKQVYTVVSKNRHKLPGSTTNCKLKNQ